MTDKKRSSVPDLKEIEKAIKSGVKKHQAANGVGASKADKDGKKKQK